MATQSGLLVFLVLLGVWFYEIEGREVFRSANNGSFAAPITSLPGLEGNPSFSQYSGYVNVQESAGRKLFFWFVESQRDPKNDPLVLWLNGGPGCSSVFGLITEHGPFRINPDGKTLSFNKFSWNKVASVIYLETPSGVGFSYSTDKNYTTGDDQVAVDNFNFLLGFFQLFPEFQTNDFYVAGESYAGNYVPQLVRNIVKGNKAGISKINLLGFLAGNPTFDFAVIANAYFPFMAEHTLVSQAEFAQANETCHGQFSPPYSKECEQLVDQISQENFALLNPYNIEDLCLGAGPGENRGCFAQQILLAQNSKRFISVHSQKPLGQTFVPCIETASAENYFARSDVRAALHIPKEAFTWSVCSKYVNYVQYYASVVDIYTQLLQQLPNLKIAVYSGDLDSCVTVKATEQTVRELNLPIKEKWRPWSLIDETNSTQTAGYVTRYANNVYFITVKGAGHMVPTYKPQAALVFFSHFLSNTPI